MVVLKKHPVLLPHWALLFLFSFMLTFPFASLGKDIVRYSSSITKPDPKEAYFTDLLTLALEVTTAEYGGYEIQGVPLEMGQKRSAIMIKNNKLINLTWRMTSKKAEQELKAIYVPILRGAMGYRIFIIRKDGQDLFPKNIPLEQLQKLHLGQGYEWQDNNILSHNQFTLVEGAPMNLLAMLAKKRFDYFPRALHEVWTEMEDIGNEFSVEKNLLLKYTAPVYFFINKENTRLMSRLSKGLNLLADNGELKRFFATHPVTMHALNKSKLSTRKVFELSNPFISAETQRIIDHPKYWLDIND